MSEMEDYNDYEEAEGYFARLERQKSLRSDGGAPGAGARPPCLPPGSTTGAS
jgi:hypothetical protein